jgi:hypothetical protein
MFGECLRRLRMESIIKYSPILGRSRHVGRAGNACGLVIFIGAGSLEVPKMLAPCKRTHSAWSGAKTSIGLTANLEFGTNAVCSGNPCTHHSRDHDTLVGKQDHLEGHSLR